jgi:adenine C2-methylase RlmN of 23S rRNA A2503 and tRNA A37
MKFLKKFESSNDRSGKYQDLSKELSSHLSAISDIKDKYRVEVEKCIFDLTDDYKYEKILFDDSNILELSYRFKLRIEEIDSFIEKLIECDLLIESYLGKEIKCDFCSISSPGFFRNLIDDEATGIIVIQHRLNKAKEYVDLNNNPRETIITIVITI